MFVWAGMSCAFAGGASQSGNSFSAFVLIGRKSKWWWKRGFQDRDWFHENARAARECRDHVRMLHFVPSFVSDCGICTPRRSTALPQKSQKNGKTWTEDWQFNQPINRSIDSSIHPCSHPSFDGMDGSINQSINQSIKAMVPHEDKKSH